VLEVGVGTGYYSLHVARWLEPSGTLDVLDIQHEMLDQTVCRAHESGISNIIPVRGDAQDLPYPDNCFDAAYLNFVLGEIPDQDATLRELRRILKPGGRLVVGEAFTDPTWSGSESSARGRKRQDLSLSAGLVDLWVTTLASPREASSER
jgi:ubiquinone/menaquinone biosynthesis C-methylase UbiE